MTNLKVSTRAHNMPVSSIRNLAQAQSQNIHVYRLNIGQPDLPSPKEYLDAVCNFHTSTLAYDAAKGNKSLLAEWSSTLNNAYSLSLTPDNFVITSGSSEALTFCFNICCDVGDEILVFSPTYSNYTGFSVMSGVKLVSVPCSFYSNFHLPTNDAEIELRITPKTKAILICNPNNPTGTVYTKEELDRIHALCVKHNLFLLVDEVYREFVYDGRTPSTALSTFPNSQHVVVLDSISKRYSLCGARIGCMISYNEEFMAAATNFASTRVSAPTIEQEAAAHMLKNLPPSYLSDAVKEYESRKQTLVSNLATIPGVGVNVPEGGFYVYASLPVADVSDFCRFMEYSFSHNNETVSISPGTAFQISTLLPTNCVRIAFVLSSNELVRSVEILKEALHTYLKGV